MTPPTMQAINPSDIILLEWLRDNMSQSKHWGMGYDWGMTSLHSPSDDTSTLNLKRLFLLRNIAIGGEFLAIFIAHSVLNLHIPTLPLVIILVIYAGVNVLTWRVIKRNQPIKPNTFAMQLAVDTLVFACLLYFVGGYTNPFVSLFLLPLVITASILPKVYTWAMAALTIVCYTVLMFRYTPLPHLHTSHESSDFDLHVLGMWFSFLLSAALILFFVVKMAHSLRERDQALALAREKALQDEHLVTLGTLATGAAHELGTPLSTMAVLAKELETDFKGDQDITEKAEIIRTQVDRCKTILSDISATTGQNRAEGGSRLAVDRYFEQIIAQWQNLRPNANAHYHSEGCQPVPVIFADKTLTQAIINLLNNAADASINEVDIHAQWSETHLTLSICDQGPGITENIQQSLGTPFFTTKEDGHGLGLYLARAVIERYNGTLMLDNRPEGGVKAQIIIPLK